MSLVQKTRLFAGVLSGLHARTGPFFVVLDVTRRCNFTCVGCRSHSPEFRIPSTGDPTVEDLPLDLFERLCLELKAMGTGELIFTGEGEPFLNPAFVEMVAIAKKAGFFVRVISNGTFLDEQAIASLLDSRLDVLRISLWASTPEEFARHYPGTHPSYFKKIIEGVKRLCTRKAEANLTVPLVGFHQPLTRHNFRHLEEMIPLVRDTGCDALFFAPLKNRRGELQEFTLSPEQEKDVTPRLAHTKRQLQALGIRHNIDQALFRYRTGEQGWKAFPCYIAWVHAHVKVDGTVLACNRPNLPMGNLHEHDFRTIWNAPPYREFRRQTITRASFASFGEAFDCGFCCHVQNNARMHRIFRYFSPILQHRNSAEIPRETTGDA